MSKLTITGATPKPPPGTATPQRLEISTFVKDIKQFSLYIQALQTIYAKSTNNVASYYQISGIHGMPYVDWDGSPSRGRGYCVHGTVLFATWHRPYVTLFEQEVQKIAKDIAATYQVDKLDWEKAAANLRQPYWGWDSLSTFVPPDEIIAKNTVEIIKPNGQRGQVQNPFMSYRFPPGSIPQFPSGLAQYPATVRYPDQSGQSQPDVLKQVLNAISRQVVNDTQRLFSITNWRDFVEGSRSTSGLEDIHNTMHVRIGGSGHMSVVPAAAFDPIFYLHHTQVDRIISMWYEQHRQWETSTQDLTPFWNSQTTYWQAPAISNPSQALNYSYEPIVTGLQADQPAMRVFAAARTLAVPAEHPAVQDISDNQLSLFAAAPNNELPTGIREWSVRVSCKRFEIGGSFSVYVFLGPVPPNPDKWLMDPSLAGTYDLFVNENLEECANCRDQADSYTEGFVHLNYALFSNAKCRSLANDDILPYLRDHKNLSWAIRKASGEVVNIDQFPSLQVTVLVTPLELPVGAEYPNEAEPEYFHHITRGRLGGHRHDES